MNTIDRFITSPVTVGDTIIGDGKPITIQSMTNSNTLDIKATVDQIKSLFISGADMVRITVPGMKEVEAMKIIRKKLHREGFTKPLIADVHFHPEVAEAVVPFVEKVRINPGNYVDKSIPVSSEQTETEYKASLEKMAMHAKPLLDLCKENGTAIRVGVNHGSLCQRIINRYGNGPLAMTMSAIEWIEICENFGFEQVLFSMKSSNVQTMNEATLLLVDKMQKRGKCYPLHLGVTEAGCGLDGRVKSAVGIGALLRQGIGDTIRVSLTEAPESEILFAKQLISATRESSLSDYFIDKDRILTYSHPELNREKWIAGAAAACGYEHYQSRLKEIIIQNHHYSEAENRELADSISQACRIRMTKTEFISCPTCGRTQYNIWDALDRIKTRFSHYPGLIIAVMGCVVNGPGEMADADYGIVGAGKGRVIVYKGKEKISKIVPEDEGLELLEQELLLRSKI